MAPTTSSSRCLVARRLGLTAASQRNRFSEHLVTDLGPQGREWHDVGSDAHDPLDVACYATEGQDAGPLGKVDEEVEVAVATGLATRNAPEHPHVTTAMRRHDSHDRLTVPSHPLAELGPSHRVAIRLDQPKLEVEPGGAQQPAQRRHAWIAKTRFHGTDRTLARPSSACQGSLRQPSAFARLTHEHTWWCGIHDA